MSWNRLLEVDRRWIWLVLLVLLAIPILAPIGLPIKITPDTQKFYDYIGNIPDGSLIVIDCAYSFGSTGELNPMFQAIFRHALQENLRVVIRGMWREGPQICQGLAEPIAQELGKEYGKDWINLGFRAPWDSVLRQSTEDIAQAHAGVDHFGKPLSDYPIMQDAKAINAEHFKAYIVLDTGDPGAPDVLAIVGEPTKLPVGVGVIQMSIPGVLPYVNTGQYFGYVGGSRGAAEYEQLVGKIGIASGNQDALSLAAIFAFLMVILGNLAWWQARKQAA